MKKFTLITALMLLSVFAFAQKPVRFGVYLGEATPLGAMGSGEIKKTVEYPLGDLSKWAPWKGWFSPRREPASASAWNISLPSTAL